MKNNVFYVLKYWKTLIIIQWIAEKFSTNNPIKNVYCLDFRKFVEPRKFLNPMLHRKYANQFVFNFEY